MLSPLLALILLLGAGAATAARQDVPEETEIAPGITGASLAVADLAALPADANLVLFAREVLAPGGVVPGTAGQSVGLFYVESGELTVTGGGEGTIIRAGSPDLETRQPGNDVVLAAGDALSVGVCAEGGFRNDGSEPVSFLVAAVTSLNPPSCSDATPTAAGDVNSGLTLQFLALGAVDPPPALPAQLGITQLSYAPGAADPQPAPYAGTVLARVETGTFGMTIESGEGTVIRKPANPSDFFAAHQDPLIQGIESTLNPGDLIWLKRGTVFQTRNTGVDPGTLLILVFEAATTGAGTPTASDT
jgi:mannose-6-phosphate isomerase-like protein (cupin superfamily)